MAEQFELDVQVLNSNGGDVEPQVTSVSFCTPGCANTATLCTSCVFACA
jgi:lantibiotic bacteriocin